MISIAAHHRTVRLGLHLVLLLRQLGLEMRWHRLIVQLLELGLLLLLLLLLKWQALLLL